MKNWLPMVLVLSTLFVSIIGCGGKKDTITTVKKGHFTDAPNITVEELVKRYQYVNSDTIKWRLENDINDDEYVIAESLFESSDIVLAGIREMLMSGAIDVSVITHYWDEFCFNFLASMNSGNHETFDFRIDYIPIDQYTEVSHFDIMGAYYEFDHEDPKTAFFNCTGGKFIVNFIVKNNGIVDVKGGSLIFNMTSPVEGLNVDYEFIYNLEEDLIKEKLLSNSDFGIQDL